MAQPGDGKAAVEGTPAAGGTTKAAGAGAAQGGGGDKVAKGAEVVADMRILKTLAKHLWPEDNPEYRMRVGGALALLVSAKVRSRRMTCPAVAGLEADRQPACPLSCCSSPAALLCPGVHRGAQQAPAPCTVLPWSWRRS